ncbi:stage V sporulation protein AC [Vallitalea pronyensis]|uniref:Stage V sporulation protein AC n=1 Tax=Vallitalea pronyensis TaxID=1348613 RepID=A0A8J8SG36_9FIRM|nr:stage V sporulation protein AC [Vallitalea pronyensis]QUI21974.1 stage V sporulation protein AC [Vallitalea pronyensis]
MPNINEQKKAYQKLVDQTSPKPNLFKNCLWAFGVGGLICCIGQVINDVLMYNAGLSKDTAATFTSIILVFLGALLTGLDLYDSIGKKAGAGSVVPITGFANSVVSPAIEYKKEGYVFGVGAKIFTIAGPVILYGVLSSVIVGLIYFMVGV